MRGFTYDMYCIIYTQNKSTELNTGKLDSSIAQIYKVYILCNVQNDSNYTVDILYGLSLILLLLRCVRFVYYVIYAYD